MSLKLPSFTFAYTTTHTAYVPRCGCRGPKWLLHSLSYHLSNTQLKTMYVECTLIVLKVHLNAQYHILFRVCTQPPTALDIHHFD